MPPPHPGRELVQITTRVGVMLPHPCPEFAAQLGRILLCHSPTVPSLGLADGHREDVHRGDIRGDAVADDG